MKVPLLNSVEGPGVPLLNFEGDPGVLLLNFKGVPVPTFKLWGGVPDPGFLVPLLHHAASVWEGGLGPLTSPNNFSKLKKSTIVKLAILVV